MQTIEAIFSLLVFVVITTQFLLIESRPIDNSLYQAQLADDIWRVLYLNGDFEDFSFNSGNKARDKVEVDLRRITDLTNICIFIGGERVTSCRAEETGMLIITTEKILVVDGSPQKVALTLKHRLSSKSMD